MRCPVYLRSSALWREELLKFVRLLCSSAVFRNALHPLGTLVLVFSCVPARPSGCLGSKVSPSRSVCVVFAGLEKRVRSLVDGYRELNELVEQAPARVSDAASEYAQALGLRPQDPPLAAGAGGGTEDESSSQASVGSRTVETLT